VFNAEVRMRDGSRVLVGIDVSKPHLDVAVHGLRVRGSRMAASCRTAHSAASED